MLSNPHSFRPARLSLAALVLLVVCSGLARADAPAFPDPSGDWSGSYLILNEDDTPRWWGDIEFTVGSNGVFEGTGDLHNHHGGYWTLEVRGVVRADGSLTMVIHDSVGDTAVFLSIESSLSGDDWTLDFRLEATYDVLPGVMELARS
jgi:hypothetical protein